MKSRYLVVSRALGGAARSHIRARCAPVAPEKGGAAFQPVTDQVLANPDPSDWLMVSRTFNDTFQPLNQINKSNVGQLRMAGRAACRRARRNRRPSSIAREYLFAPAPRSRP